MSQLCYGFGRYKNSADHKQTDKQSNHSQEGHMNKLTSLEMTLTLIPF